MENANLSVHCLLSTESIFSEARDQCTFGYIFDVVVFLATLVGLNSSEVMALAFGLEG